MAIEYVPLWGVIALVVFVFIVLSWAVSAMLAGRRRDALAAIARNMGLDFDATAPADELPQLPVFRKGRSQRVRNRMRGTTQGVRADIFDFSYVTGTSRRRRIRQTVFVFTLAQPLPTFLLTHETFIDRLEEKFGLQDIDFKSDPEFSSLYLLRGEDESTIRKLFQRDVTRCLTMLDPQPNIEARGTTLAIYRYNTISDPPDLRAQISAATDLAKMFRTEEE